MKNVRKFILLTILVISLGISITTISAQSNYEIPSWVKGMAGFWSEGKISDSEFGEGLTYLIDNNIVQVPKIKQLENRIVHLENENKALQNKLDKTNSEYSAKQPIPSSQKCSGSAKCVSEMVTQIVDGDTIYTKSYKIRLSLTNTPERNESGFAEATAFTSKMCPVGSTILIDQDDKQLYDNYGRLLANIYCGEKSLNSALLNNGHANISTQYCDTSEFSGESWAQSYGCKEEKSVAKIPVETPKDIIIDAPKEIPKETGENCDKSYPDVCIAPYPPDLDCGDITFKKFRVVGSDPHRFDSDKDGIGCES